MPGLLDNLLADDTTKDEFGQTQADRRQPLWSGLIKAGLLGVAAGGDLMPSERAKMVGQMGGAIGDIPNEMMQYRSGAAQQALRGQQVATGKTKLANIAKLQALAKSPEFLDSIKDLKPHEKIAMQAAIDAGDIDAFAKITGQVGTGAYKDQQLDIARQRNLMAEERVKIAQEKADKSFGGGTTGQVLDLLTNGDPASKDYYTAYNHYMISNSKPAIDKDGNATFVEPDMKRFRPPTYNANAAPTAPTGTPPPAPAPTGTEPPTPAPGTPPPAPTASPTGGKDVRVVPNVVPQKPTSLGQEHLSAITGGLNILDQVDQLNQELNTKPNILVGTTANQILNRAGSGGVTVLDRMDPEGVRARALIASLTAEKIKELSGKAASDAEVQRLISLLPQPTDDPPTIRQKLPIFQRAFDLILKAQHDNLKGTKSNIPEGLVKRYGNKGSGGGKRTVKQFKDGKIVEVEVE